MKGKGSDKGPGFAWAWRMARRDARKSRGRLFLFSLAIVLGIAAIVSINGFQQDLERAIDKEALSLLGADIEIEAYQPIDTSKLGFLKGYDLKEAEARNFASMASFSGSEKGARLVQVLAYGKGFPFYGELETEPAEAAQGFRYEGGALVAAELMEQFELHPGDSIRLGKKRFLISGALKKTPGGNELRSAIATPVAIPLEELESTGLIQKGSRVEYKRYYAFRDRSVYEAEREAIEDSLRTSDLDHETVDQEKEDVGDAFSNLTGYLNLVGFVALILGCIGVGSSVHIYMKEKVRSVAVLRCIGADRRSILRIFGLQVSMIGLFASLIGAATGTLLQAWMPEVMRPFLPFTLETRVSWSAIGIGASVGVVFSLLFSLLPLIQISGTSPMRALSSLQEEERGNGGKERNGIFLLLALAIFLFAYFQTGSWIGGLFFFLGLLTLLLVLLGIGKLLMKGARRLFSRRWGFPLRQGVANLFRPNGQTLVLILAIGLATALVSTLLLSRNMLNERASITGRGDGPNTILFDVQSEQKDSVKRFLDKEKIPLHQEVPIVPMRIRRIEGERRGEMLADTSNERREHLLEREYRATYRDTLIGTETLVKGKWIGEADPSEGAIPISVEEDIFRELKLSLGDRIDWNVQGADLETEVASVRRIEWRKVQTNFLVLFPKGVLEKAPQTHALMARTDSSHLQRNSNYRLIQRFPNVSLIDLERILESLDEVLEKISFAVRFMGSFSIATGIVILIGSLVLTKYQRLRESALLRTLGAERRKILWIQFIEYAALGTIGSFTGILLGVMSSWVLAHFWFDVPLVLPALPLTGIWGAVLVLTIGIGLWNARGVLKHPPSRILQGE